MAKPKELKEEAFYSIVPRADGKRCADCIFFQQVPGTVDMSGTCARVTGIIKRDASCDLYETKPVENAPWPYRTRRRHGYYGGEN